MARCHVVEIAENRLLSIQGRMIREAIRRSKRRGSKSDCLSRTVQREGGG
jgi:hypothetical protein